jgi:hypothetical protein
MVISSSPMHSARRISSSVKPWERDMPGKYHALPRLRSEQFEGKNTALGPLAEPAVQASY